MQRLSGLSRRYLRERRGRALLAGIGIALGVAVLFSSLVTITSYNRGLRGMRMNSPAMDVVAQPGSGDWRVTVDDSEVDGLAERDGVDAVLRWLAVPASVATEQHPNTVHTSNQQRLTGIDVDEFERFAQIDALYDLEPTSGRLFTDDADEVMLSERHAAFLGVAAGDHLVATNLPGGEQRLLVTGLLSNESIARRNDGKLLFTSLHTARRLGGLPDAVTWVALHLEGGTSASAWIARNGNHPRLQFDTAETSVADQRTQIAEMGATFTLFASLILFVAGFLIFLTLSMAVAERQATLGILRALGASRAHLSRLVVMEAAVLGLVATVFGLAAGFGIAHVNLTYEPLGTAPFPHRGVPVTAGSLAAAVGLGIGATLVAAVVPARRAARMAPLDAMREPVGLGGGSRRSWLVGLMAFPLGLALAGVNPDSETQTGVGLVLALAGAMLVVPAVLPWICRRLLVLAAARPLRLAHVVVPHLRRERTRSAYTLGLAMVVMAMASAMGASMSSASRTGEKQIGAQATGTVTIYGGVFDDELLRRVEELPGIATATATWGGRTGVPDAGRREMLVTAIDPETYFEVSTFAWVSGSDEHVARRLAGSRQVVVPERLAQELGVDVDDTIVLTTTRGQEPFTVAGTYVSVASSLSQNDWSTLIIGVRDGRSSFGFDGAASGITGRVEPGADVDSVVAAVKDLQTETTFVVLSDREIRSRFDQTIEIGRNLTASILVPAALVSAVGLANTLAVAVLERRREIGVLRAIGLHRGQARSLALMEAGVLVAVAAVLSIPLGYALSRPLVDLTATSLGVVLHYAFPWRWLAVTALMSLALAVVAAIAPARRAARIDVSAALRFE